MTAAVCADCAIEYETWPPAGCSNCGCGEPRRPEPEPEPTAVEVPELVDEAPEPLPEPAPAKPARNRRGR